MIALVFEFDFLVFLWCVVVTFLVDCVLALGIGLWALTVCSGCCCVEHWPLSICGGCCWICLLWLVSGIGFWLLSNFCFVDCVLGFLIL